MHTYMFAPFGSKALAHHNLMSGISLASAPQQAGRLPPEFEDEISAEGEEDEEEEQDEEEEELTTESYHRMMYKRSLPKVWSSIVLECFRFFLARTAFN